MLVSIQLEYWWVEPHLYDNCIYGFEFFYGPFGTMVFIASMGFLLVEWIWSIWQLSVGAFVLIKSRARYGPVAFNA